MVIAEIPANRLPLGNINDIRGRLDNLRRILHILNHNKYSPQQFYQQYKKTWMKESEYSYYSRPLRSYVVFSQRQMKWYGEIAIEKPVSEINREMQEQLAVNQLFGTSDYLEPDEYFLQRIDQD